MRRRFLLLAAVPAGLATVFATWLVLGLRFEVPFFRDGIRRMNRAVMNPMQVRNGAGEEGSWVALIHHVGRTSGRPYTTPIGTAPYEDGIVVVLPYGPDADWVRNVLAAGHAELDQDGTRLRVTDPRVVPLAEVDGHDDPAARLFGVRDALLLRVEDADPRPDAD